MMSKKSQNVDSMRNFNRSSVMKLVLENPGIDRRGNMNMSGKYLTTLLALLGRNASRHSLSIDQILETKTHTFVRFHQGAREFCMYLWNDSQQHTHDNFREEIGSFYQGFDLQKGRMISSDQFDETISGIVLETV